MSTFDPMLVVAFVIQVGLVAVLLAFVLPRIGPWQRRGVKAAAAGLAESVGGYVIFDLFRIWPTIVFRHAGVAGKIDFEVRHNLRARTRFFLRWPDRKLHLEVACPLNWPQFDMTALEHVPVANSSCLAVFANDPEKAVLILDQPVREAIENLRHVSGSGVVHLQIASGVFLVQVSGVLRTLAGLQQFHALATRLFEEALAARKGIEFITASAPSEQPICQVCGEPLITDVVTCRRCRTPHHQDCWQYFGACSVYGCQETEYVPTER